MIYSQIDDKISARKGLLGASAGALGLIVTAPFSGGGPGVPTPSAPAKSAPAPAKAAKKVAATSAPSAVKAVEKKKVSAKKVKSSPYDFRLVAYFLNSCRFSLLSFHPKLTISSSYQT